VGTSNLTQEFMAAYLNFRILSKMPFPVRNATEKKRGSNSILMELWTFAPMHV
jgi:hypothetical protein